MKNIFNLISSWKANEIFLLAMRIIIIDEAQCLRFLISLFCTRFMQGWFVWSQELIQNYAIFFYHKSCIYIYIYWLWELRGKFCISRESKRQIVWKNMNFAPPCGCINLLAGQLSMGISGLTHVASFLHLLFLFFFFVPLIDKQKKILIGCLEEVRKHMNEGSLIPDVWVVSTKYHKIWLVVFLFNAKLQTQGKLLKINDVKPCIYNN